MKYRGVLKENAGMVGVSLYFIDWLAIISSSLLAHWLYLDDFLMPERYWFVVLVSLLLSALLFPRFSLYLAWRGSSLLDEAWRLLLAWGGVLLGLMGLAFTTKTGVEYSRGWFILWSAFGAVHLVVARSVLRTVLRWARMRGFNQRHIIIVGNREIGEEVARRIQDAPWAGLEMVGFFEDQATTTTGQDNGVSVLGGLTGVAAYVAENDIDQVWITMALRDEEKVQWLLHELRHSTVDIRFVPDLFGLRLLNHSVMDVAGLPVMNLSVTPMTGLNRWLKAIEDRLIAALILILISPVMLAISLGVKFTSPGPVLFKQKRYGWEGKPIMVYKFRSMFVHTEEHGVVTQSTDGDTRITRFGAFLRRTSLDELPQFYNVLQGRMSIVGPRPHAVSHNEQYKDLVDDYMKRHKVKPGITGWAQINGWRGETDTIDKMKKRVEFDLFYIENWSLWFDIKIIFSTILNGFVHENAR